MTGITDQFVEELLLTFARAQKTARAEGYAAGQREMRERAVIFVLKRFGAAMAFQFEDALSIIEPKDKPA